MIFCILFLTGILLFFQYIILFSDIIPHDKEYKYLLNTKVKILCWIIPGGLLVIIGFLIYECYFCKIVEFYKSQINKIEHPLNQIKKEQLENLKFIQQAENRHIEFYVTDYTSSHKVHLKDKIYNLIDYLIYGHQVGHNHLMYKELFLL